VQQSGLSLDALLADPKATARALDCADARESLADFCGLIEIPGAPIDEDEDAERFVQARRMRHRPRTTRLLIEKLEAVERGEIKRLMVFMPPGSAKSTYASVVFPVWFMGRRSAATSSSRPTPRTWPARSAAGPARSSSSRPIARCSGGLSPDSAAADEWALTNENEFMGGGILSGITGNRADLIVIDDPIKGRQRRTARRSATAPGPSTTTASRRA
jgi:hypothetical protein